MTPSLFIKRTVGALALAMLLAVLAGCSTGPQRQSLGEYIDDSVVTGKVKAAIVADPGLRLSGIHVESFHGVVQLSGFVDDQGVVSRASEVVRHVDGVRFVKNDLRVKNAP